MPLWFRSCHKSNFLKIGSRSSITPSLFPPNRGSSNIAKAEKPFRNSPTGGRGCGVMFPNNSLPLSILPFRSRSSDSHASSESIAVQESCFSLPLPKKSNRTPFAASVKLKPFPATSITIGVNCRQQPPASGFVQSSPSSSSSYLQSHVPAGTYPPLHQQSSTKCS